MIYLFLAFFLMALLWSFQQPSRVERCVQKARHIQDPSPISEEIQRRPQELQSRFFHQSMELLWLATPEPSTSQIIHDLCLFFVQKNPTLSSGHKWISKIQQERPEMMTDELMQNYDCTYLNQKEAG